MAEAKQELGKRLEEQVKSGIISDELLLMCYDAVERHCAYADQAECEQCPWELDHDEHTCLGTLLLDLLQHRGLGWENARMDGITALERMAEGR